MSVSESRLSTLFEYDSFADYWSTFLTGQGKTGSIVAGRVAWHVEKEILCQTISARMCFS